MTTPTRIEFNRERYRIWIDEDGVHVSIPRSGAFEQPEVLELIADYQAIHAEAADRGAFRIPAPPTREEIRDMSYLRHESYARKAAVKAVTKALTPPGDIAEVAPF